MSVLLILIAKVLLFGLPYFLFIGLATAIFGNLGRLFSGQKVLQLFYSIIVTFVYIYLYSFWGAYLKSIVISYSEIYNKKWLLVLLCTLSIPIWIVHINKQLQEEKSKMNKLVLMLGVSNKEVFLQSITVTAFNNVIYLPISFIIFQFTDTIHNTLFFEVPKYLSMLFL
jgi:hypothetical protein